MAAADTDSFKHQPLPTVGIHIRLLTLWPSQHFNEPIRCDLQVVKLADSREILRGEFWRWRPPGCPTYSALSYTWGMNDTGDATPNCEIIVNSKKKAVSQNLFEGLLRIRQRSQSSGMSKVFSKLRGRDGAIVIWIDAVCIDQENIPERNAQVGIMDSIYRFAAHLLIWLGEGRSEREDRAVLSLFKCSTAKYSTRYTGSLMHEWHVNSEDFPKRHAILPEHAWSGSDNQSRNSCVLGPNAEKSRSEVAEDAGDPKGEATRVALLDEMAQVLDRFISRRYFTRRWILQENFYGREGAKCDVLWGPVRCTHGPFRSILRSGILCTHHLLMSAGYEPRGDSPPRIDPEKLEAVWALFKMGTRASEEASNIIGNMWEEEPSSGPSDNPADADVERLLVMLEYGSQYDCSNPKDRLFALASFVSPALGIVPDYSVSIEATYTLLARKLIEKGYIATNLLNLRARIGRSVNSLGENEQSALGPDKLNLPSWVPDLRGSYAKDGFYAYKQSTMKVSFEDGNIMRCLLGHMGVVETPPTSEAPQVMIRPAREQDITYRMVFEAEAFRGSIPVGVYDHSQVRRGDILARLFAQQDWRGEHVCVLRPSDDEPAIHRIVNHFDLCYVEAKLLDVSNPDITYSVVDEGIIYSETNLWKTLCDWTIYSVFRIE